MSRINSIPGLFGGEDFYDANGAPKGYSMDGILGGKDYYDADGRKTGWSTDSLFGGENIRLNDDPYHPETPDPDSYESFGDFPDDGYDG